MSGRPSNPDRTTAVALGFKTYVGSVHSRCGTSERYTTGGGCVHCARIIATEQREARKYLLRGETALDNPKPMVLEETDDAEARHDQALDDIM